MAEYDTVFQDILIPAKTERKKYEILKSFALFLVASQNSRFLWQLGLEDGLDPLEDLLLLGSVALHFFRGLSPPFLAEALNSSLEEAERRLDQRRLGRDFFRERKEV